MEVPNEIVNNWLFDLRKKEVNIFDRARLIRTYLTNKGLSIRSFSSTYGFSKSTIEDWLLWEKITEETYNELRNKGYTHTEIYKSLRDNKKLKPKEIFSGVETKLDMTLWKVCNKLKPFLDDFPEKSPKTLEIISEAKQLIETLERHYK